jgi:putative transferase (TIGR04331 family)
MMELALKVKVKAYNKNNKSGVFLATTALEEFWDTSSPIVFLGEWCRRYSRKAIWEKLNAEVLLSPFENPEILYDAHLYSSDVYKRTLKELVFVLNNLHGKNYSENYWRIVIGPWLFHYIDILYERYRFIKAAIEKYPDLTTIVLAKQCFITPKDSGAFSDLFGDDLYNLQIYTNILDQLGKIYNVRGTQENSKISQHEELKCQNISLRFSANLKKYVRKCLKAIYKFRHGSGNKVVGVFPFFRPSIDLMLFFKSMFRYRPLSHRMYEVESVPLDKSMRSKIRIETLRSNEFETILTHMLPHDMPQSFIETYNLITQKVHKNYPPYPNIIFTAVSYYFDEFFKQWAAEASEKGTVLIGTQHGGDYGSTSFMLAMDHEIAITDRFYSWGWDSTETCSNIVPMPATSLMGRKVIGASNNKEGVLFASTSRPRYLYRIQNFNNVVFSDYLNWQFRFIESVAPAIQKELIVRLFLDDYGWDLSERWDDRFPEIATEGREIPFLKSMADCRIFVCDHLSTVHSESLSANKPTILYWNPQIIILKPEALPYYDELRDVRILHDTPETAAATLCSVYDDVEGWWNETARQTAVKRYCDRFARTSLNAVDEWANELMKIASTEVPLTSVVALNL